MMSSTQTAAHLRESLVLQQAVQFFLRLNKSLPISAVNQENYGIHLARARDDSAILVLVLAARSDCIGLDGYCRQRIYAPPCSVSPPCAQWK